jgi:glucose/arabinose dehydrogenase
MVTYVGGTLSSMSPIRRPLWTTLAALAGAALVGALALQAVLPSAAQAAGGFDFTRPQIVATGLATPWGMAFLPDGSAVVAERDSARLLQVRAGSSPVVLGTVSGVVPGGEGGLLGLAVSPTFSQDNLVYAYFTAANDNRIVRFPLNAVANQTVVLSGLAKATIHNGGRIAFGPDGMLYAGVGDAGQTANAQNQQSRNGKILRMRPDGTVPPDNPFANSLVYSLGHRNVQGLAWDAQDRLYATEFGQNTWDEVNQIVAGGNYGWPTVEGIGNNPGFRNPIVQWSTAEASPSGAAIANNTLFAAALRGTRLWAVPLTSSGGAGTPVAELQGQFGRLRTVVAGPDGWLWVTTSNRDGRGTPAASDDRILRFPPLGTSPSDPASSSTPSSSTPSASGSQPAGGCAVRWEVNDWGTGFVVNVTVTNGGPALTGWALTWTFSGNQRITGAWQTRITQTGTAVNAANETYNANLAANGTVAFGFQGTYTGGNARPTDIRLGPTPCTVT